MKNFYDDNTFSNNKVTGRISSAERVQIKHTNPSCSNFAINCASISKNVKEDSNGNKRVTSNFENCSGIKNFENLSFEDYVLQKLIKDISKKSECKNANWEIEFTGNSVTADRGALKSGVHIHSGGCGEYIECNDVQASIGSGSCVLEEGEHHH